MQKLLVIILTGWLLTGHTLPKQVVAPPIDVCSPNDLCPVVDDMGKTIPILEVELSRIIENNGALEYDENQPSGSRWECQREAVAEYANGAIESEVICRLRESSPIDYT